MAIGVLWRYSGGLVEWTGLGEIGELGQGAGAKRAGIEGRRE